MDSVHFIRGLQFTDSFFPVGAFAYSDGLETAAARGRVHDADSLGEWMHHFLDSVFAPCEGLALLKCMLALKAEDLNTLRLLDEELTAIRPAGAVRAASMAVGKRLLSLYASTYGQRSLTDLATLPNCNAAAAYAVVFFDSGLNERDAVLAYGYNRLAGIVSAGLRLISLGQQQGQALLKKALDRLPAVVDRIQLMKDEPLRSFTPLLDIEQMNHQHVYSKLFRS